LRFARISGKGNIGRYRDFFRRFKARVFVVTDLDFILGCEFKQVEPTEKSQQLRNELLAEADKEIAQIVAAEPSRKQIMHAHDDGRINGVWRRARPAYAGFRGGTGSMEDVVRVVDEFFAWEKKSARWEVLAKPKSENIRTKKAELLSELRRSDVCVWERGAIEDYYPENITGDSKPARAQQLCERVTTKEEATAVLGSAMPEFMTVFETLFAPAEAGAA
jgi:hypothetical protein